MVVLNDTHVYTTAFDSKFAFATIAHQCLFFLKGIGVSLSLCMCVCVCVCVCVYVCDSLRGNISTTDYSKAYVKLPLNLDKTKSLMTNGSLRVMKVKSIAECSKRIGNCHFF